MACYAKSRCKQNIPKINTRQGCETDIGWPFGGRRTPAWRWQNGRKATVGGQNGSCCIAIRPVLRPRKACFMAQNGRRGGLSYLFRRVFPPKREQNAPPSERNRLWVNHLRKVLRGWRFYSRRAPDGRRRRSQRGCCKHCSPFLTVRSRAGHSAASWERTTHKRAPGPRCRPGHHAVSAPGLPCA